MNTIYFTSIRDCKTTCLVFFASFLFAFSTNVNGIFAQTPAEVTGWVAANGMVETIHDDGTHVYIGGTFTHVGVANRRGAQISTSTGFPVGKTLNINGTVRCSAPDGSGGWFIGGDFASVNDVMRVRVAHILANGDLDMAWSAQVDGAVHCMEVYNGALYIGGEFATVNGVTRNRLAALQTSNGALSSFMSSNVSANGNVFTMRRDGHLMYIGGAFTAVSNHFNGINMTRGRLAILDLSGSEVVLSDLYSGFGANNGSIFAVEVSQNFVYIGGDFTLVPGSASHVRLARFNKNTTLLDGSYIPAPNNVVRTMFVDPFNDFLHVGGDFTTISSATRVRLAYLQANGSPFPFRSDANNSVRSIKPDFAGNIVVAGDFTSIGTNNALAPSQNLQNTRFAIMSAGTGVISTSINQSAQDNNVFTANVASGKIFLGGQFIYSNMMQRSRVARFTRSNMALDLNWNVNLNGKVNTITSSGNDFVYLGGEFTSVIGNSSANRLVRLSKADGAIDASWLPNPNDIVHKILISGTHVYVGGRFTICGTGTALAMSKLSTSSAIQDPNWLTQFTWAGSGTPQPEVFTFSFNETGTRMMVGGSFNRVNNIFRNNGGFFNVLADGNLTLDNSSCIASGVIRDIVADGNDFIAVGEFTSMNSLTRNRMARFNLTGSDYVMSNNWDPNANNTIMCAAVYDDRLYAGGMFSQIGSVPFYFLTGRVNLANGAADNTFTPQVLPSNTSVRVYEVKGTRLYFGGAFTNVNNNFNFDKLMVYDMPCASLNISSQPISTSACVGVSAAFNVTSNGTGLTYQWRRNGTPISGANSPSFSISAVTTIDAAQYDVVITDACGNQITSNASFLTVNEPITVFSQPFDVEFCTGWDSQFEVIASNVDTYQWTFNGVPVSGATSNTLDLNNVTAANAGTYVLQMTGFCGIVNFQAATITVESAPTITSNLINQTICTGQPLNLSATTTGDNLTFEWLKNGVVISGTTSSSYTIPSTVSTDAGNYKVSVSNSCGSVASNTATITIIHSPSITTQPTSHIACAGTAHTFTVNATGDNLNYNWLVNGNSFQSGPTASLSLSNINTFLAGTFQVEVSNSCGTVTSNLVNLTVNDVPQITTQPQANTAVCSGNTLNLSVVASGGTVAYQWRKNGVNIPGATSSSFTISNVAAGDAADYTVVVSNSCGSVTSNVANVTVTPLTSIATQPVSASVCVGSNHTFNVLANGAGLNYQWFLNGSAIAGGTQSSLIASTAGNYQVQVTGTCGSVTSQTVSLTLISGPSIVNQPQSTAVCAGQNGSLSVVADGTNLSYQWFKDGVALVGATNASYAINGMNAGFVGAYHVVVSGNCGPDVTSSTVNVSMNAAPQYSSIPPSASYCEGESVSLSAVILNNPTNVQWFANGNLVDQGTSGTLNIPSISSTNAGTWVINAMNNCGNNVSSVFTITVNPTYDITIQETVCAGSSVVVAGSTFTSTGNYQIVLQTAAGCDSIVNLNLEVLPTLSSSISATICEGDTYDFNGQILTIENTYTQVIPVSVGSITCDSTVTLVLIVIDPSSVFSAAANICFGETYVFGTQNLTTSGLFTEVFLSSAGCDSIVELTLTVAPEILNTVSVSDVTLTAFQNNASYQWVDCANNNAPIAGATSQSFTPTENGSYAVIITIGDCESTSNCVDITSVSIDESEIEKMLVYPNPATDVLYVQNANIGAQITVRDMSGRLIFESTASHANISINTEAWQSGLYLIQVEWNGYLQTEKVVVQN
jgi:hypothetical protein